MSPAKCDSDGNLYIRKLATDRPMLGPVVRIDRDGQRVAVFDPASFSQPQVGRADTYAPSPDGGLYQMAGSNGLKREVYILHFSSDGSPGSATRLEQGFEPYAFAPFPDGNLLVSGFQRDPMKKPDNARPFTAVFSADGRLLAQLSFEHPKKPVAAPRSASHPSSTAESAPTLDLGEAEAGADGNVYAMRRSSPAVVYVISSAGKILRTLKISPLRAGIMPNTFHVSGNRVAVSFWDDDRQQQSLVVSDDQSGQKIAVYSDPGTLGPSFACYSADEGVFTFLHLGEGNTIEVVRAEAQ